MTLLDQFIKDYGSRTPRLVVEQETTASTRSEEGTRECHVMMHRLEAALEEYKKGE